MLNSTWQWIINNIDLTSLIIAFIALLVSIYSVWYTKRTNRNQLEITECYYDRYDENNFPFIKFWVFNSSPTGIKITNIKLLDLDYKELNILYDYEPTDNSSNSYSPLRFPTIINSWYYSDTLEGSEIIPSNDSLEFTYYLEEIPNKLIIEIYSNQRIQWFSKIKRFIVEPKESK